MLVRSQMDFPATGEVVQPNAVGPFVAACMRGSNIMPLVPVKLNSPISYFDGPPIVSCTAFSLRKGILTEAIDTFDHPFGDRVRAHVADKAMNMRSQGFFRRSHAADERVGVYGYHGKACGPGKTVCCSECEEGGVIQRVRAYKECGMTMACRGKFPGFFYFPGATIKTDNLF